MRDSLAERPQSADQKRDCKMQEALRDSAAAWLCCHVSGFALGITEDLLIPTRGSPQEALARQIAMYLTHVGFGMSLLRVANAFGRDKSTIAHACHLIEDKRNDAAFDDFLDALEDALIRLKATAAPDMLEAVLKVAL